jgi:hypothetical protein
MKISTVKISEIANDPKLKIKVRFNLGRGKHYMKWKIQSSAGVEYHSPEDVDLVLKNCQLKNNRKRAESIYNGENKDVCAWILCDSVEIKEKVRLSFTTEDEIIAFVNLTDSKRLRYNPRVHPYWSLMDECVDNNSYEELYTIGQRIFISVYHKKK